MTLTSLKPPMSGTKTSRGVTTTFAIGVPLDRQRVGFFRIDAEGLHRLGHRVHVDLAVVGQRLERGDRHVMTVYFEKAAQLRARVAATKSVRTEHRVTAQNPLPYLIGHSLDVVRGGDERS